MYSNLPTPETYQDSIIQKPAHRPAIEPAATPIVTVVTVCFNPLKAGRQTLFAKNLDSVQQQTGVLVEHVIIDGASTDGTLSFLTEYQNPHYDIRILSKRDSGIYEAMNRGIALARGKYVTFLNTDDYYHRPDGLSLSVKALSQSGCTFSFAPILPSGSPFQHRLHRHPERHLHRVFLFCTIPHPSMLFLRSALLQVDGYDCTYRLAADYDMMLRLIAAGSKVCFVEKSFVTFASDGFSGKNKQLNLQEKMLIVRHFHQKVFGIELTDEETETLVKHYRYPRKYLSVYVASQQMIGQTFVGVPQHLGQRVVQSFNYWKYYLKCLLSI
ncbi:MAG: glycosyltransferase [Prevotella sp.]|nr:glycosyltransferase [Prevotella sp.]MBP3712360.1 glycosyltransferase [Bacteroidaceae bacterium]MBQ9295055.1 glycosyltransferase [Bacteroidaceae bacterium]